MGEGWVERHAAGERVKSLKVLGLQRAFRAATIWGELKQHERREGTRVYYPASVLDDWLRKTIQQLSAEKPGDHISVSEALKIIAREGISERAFQFARARGELEFHYLRVKGATYKMVRRSELEDWIDRERVRLETEGSTAWRLQAWIKHHADFNRTIEELAAEYLKTDPEANAYTVQRTLMSYARRNDLPIYRAAQRLLAHLLSDPSLRTKSAHELAEAYKLTCRQVEEVIARAQTLLRNTGRAQWSG